MNLVVVVLTWLCCCRKVLCLSSFHRPTSQNPYFIGFDLGTSGARISVIERTTRSGNNDDDDNIIHQAQQSYSFKEVYTNSVSWTKVNDKKGSYDDTNAWMSAVDQLLMSAKQTLTAEQLQLVQSMCISGTSASCCLVDRTNRQVTRPPRMYNYDVVASSTTTSRMDAGRRALEQLDQYAPPRHMARSSTGSLAKLLAWHYEQPLTAHEILCHQSDYVRIQLSDYNDKDDDNNNLAASYCSSSSDWHNCLKLGYDVRQLMWPTWLVDCLEHAGILNPVPRGIVPSYVVSPGQPLARLRPDVAISYGLSHHVVIVAGTTDSNAAFMAAALGDRGFPTGGHDKSNLSSSSSSELVGTAVTSLGSTLALKLLSNTYVEDADRGVYSHRFPQVTTGGGSNDDDDDASLWLVGGASNVGCAVLRQQGFDNHELDTLSAGIDPATNSPLSYYPLATKRGERFPIADGNKEPCLEPVPKHRRDYLHGILQGISDVERDGYRVLGELGATPPRPSVIWTCGGGSRNDKWSAMRERRLNEAFGGSTVAAAAMAGSSSSMPPLVKVKRAENVEASFGAALLAASSFS